MTAQADRDALLRDFTALRHGYGIRSTNLRKRLGPELRRLCDIPPNATDPAIRTTLLTMVERFTRDFTAEDRKVIETALGAAQPARLQLLNVRTEQIKNDLVLSERTARRRVTRAFELLADEMLAAEPTGPEPPADPEKGWRVRKFVALLRLDTPAPELVETRTIEATRDGLRMIVARMSLPKYEAGQPTRTNLLADVQHGARIVHQEQNEGHFRYLLELPAELNQGEGHTYTIAFRIPPGQPSRTHYAFVPLVACEEFTVRVRFDPDQLPAVVWRLDRLPPVVMTNRLAPGPALALDGASEAVLTFRNMDQGFGYGLAWLPRDATRDLTVRSG
ncbi:MAG TPA: hypothetical protein VGL06_23475 [Pseudonocardiaceae bacterium]|jgi:hypothetical protein